MCPHHVEEEQTLLANSLMLSITRLNLRVILKMTLLKKAGVEMTSMSKAEASVHPSPK